MLAVTGAVARRSRDPIALADMPCGVCGSRRRRVHGGTPCTVVHEHWDVARSLGSRGVMDHGSWSWSCRALATVVGPDFEEQTQRCLACAGWLLLLAARRSYLRCCLKIYDTSRRAFAQPIAIRISYHICTYSCMCTRTRTVRTRRYDGGFHDHRSGPAPSVRVGVPFKRYRHAGQRQRDKCTMLKRLVVKS